MKLYFAEKVIVKTIPKSDLNESSKTNKLILQNEINKYKVNIDKSVFIKTKKDVNNLKIAKAQFKYNPSKKIKEEILMAFINSPIPRWNISFVITK